MAAKQLCFFLLLTLLSSISTQARDSQMFNKVPSKVNDNVVVVEDQHTTPHEVQNKQQLLDTKDQQEQPIFIPDNNENSYGLYGHESGQLPPSTTTTTTTPENNEPFKAFENNNNNNNKNQFPYNAKYLPKNYNTVAYVTQPEDFSTDSTFEGDNNNKNYYYNGDQESLQDSQFINRDFTTTTHNNNYNNGGNYYNPQEHGIGHETSLMDTAYTTNNNNINNNNNNNYYNGGRVYRVQPQGMSDTRFLENGKYYYDINAEKHSRDPVDNAKEFAMRKQQQQYSTRGYYDNNNNNYYNNNNYHNTYDDHQYSNYMPDQEQYQEEDGMP